MLEQTAFFCAAAAVKQRAELEWFLTKTKVPYVFLTTPLSEWLDPCTSNWIFFVVVVYKVGSWVLQTSRRLMWWWCRGSPGNVALPCCSSWVQGWPGIPSSSSYLLDAPGQLLPSLSVPGGFLAHCSVPAPGFQGKAWNCCPGCWGLCWAAAKDGPCFLKGMCYIIYVSLTPWRASVLLFCVLECCSKWNKAFPLFLFLFHLPRFFFLRLPCVQCGAVDR